MPIRDSPMVPRASSMEHMHSFGMPVGFKKSPLAFSGTGFAFGGARPEYIRKASTASLTDDALSALKVSASGDISRAENSFNEKANHPRTILAEIEKSKAEEELSNRKEATKTEITMRNEMDQPELLSAKARSSEILATQQYLMAKLIEDIKETLKEAYTKEIKEEVLAQYQSSTRTLKEDAKVDFIKQIASDLKAELRLELKKEVKEELVVELNGELRDEFMELKTRLKGKVTSALRAELASEVRTELKAMYTNSVKDELRALYSDQIKDELRLKLVAELDAEAETNRKLNELVQMETELEAELEDANERNPSVERGGFTEDANEGKPSFERGRFTKDANEGKPSFERDEFTENVNKPNPSAERGEFTDAASQVHTWEPVRYHDLDRSQFSMSPQHSLPESETLKADLQHTTNEPLYRAIDAPDANHDEEAISPSAKFEAESVSHEDGPGNQWGGKPGISSEDYQGDEASAMNEENIYPLDVNGAPIYYEDEEGGFGDIDGEGSFVYRDETPTVDAERTGSEPGDMEGGFGDIDGEGSFVYGDETPTVDAERTGSEPGDIDGEGSLVDGDETPTVDAERTGSEPRDEAFIKYQNNQGTNPPSSSPCPRIFKRALDAEGYWGSHPKRARDNSPESSLFLTDDEQEVEYSAREGYPSGFDEEVEGEDGDGDGDGDEDEDKDGDGDGGMDMEWGVPGPYASLDSRADWYHGGQPAVAYPLDNRGSSLDDAIELDSDSEDEAVTVIQETFQPSIERSPEPAVSGLP